MMGCVGFILLLFCLWHEWNDLTYWELAVVCLLAGICSGIEQVVSSLKPKGGDAK